MNDALIALLCCLTLAGIITGVVVLTAAWQSPPRPSGDMRK